MSKEQDPGIAHRQEQRIKGVVFEELTLTDNKEHSSREAETNELNLDLVLDVPVAVSIEIGRTEVDIKQLLELKPGSIVELDRYAGEPLDVFVNGTLVAHGEVAVTHEKFGIRLTDVISPSERVKKLT
ncbi:flagellar motor switch protein FliN [Methylosarcina fibrata]|uniref:flagellar motor switch protein FliN n=1 Tax=Methylosarcina fibrata TaxID=105972 RepID=UPI00037B211C|nr:flagellar motor switch protein FliN [Methylosarcina fibrata]